MVLDGIFSDEHGDYPAGTYVRNPVGSTHTPFSQDGCTILVKLWQMHPDDQKRVAIDTTRAPWMPGLVTDLDVMPLHAFGTEQVALVKWAADTQFPHHSHYSGEEIFVLDGVFEDEFGAYPTGTWLRSPHGGRHTPLSRQGCVIYVKTGHLPERIDSVAENSSPALHAGRRYESSLQRPSSGQTAVCPDPNSCLNSATPFFRLLANDVWASQPNPGIWVCWYSHRHLG